MKKLICFLLTAIMSFTCLASVFAAGADISNIVFELESLKIISGDEDITAPITRGEFAAMVTRLVGMGELADSWSVSCPFSDVPADSDYASAVAWLAHMGMMNGTSNSTFSPNEPVTIWQAVKVMVIATGYESLALQAGGWPNGYSSVGAASGLLSDVKTGDLHSRSEIYRVLYNALDVDMLQTVVGTENEIIKTGETLRDAHTGARKDLYSGKGVVNANSFSYVSSPVAHLGADEVVIDSVIYKIADTEAFDMVGHMVEFFAYEKGGRQYLQNIKISDDEVELTIDSENVISKSGTSLRYYENNKEKRLNLSDKVKVVLNGIRVQYPTDSLWLGDIGKLTLIDHEGNGTVDVAMIDRYESVLAKSYTDGLFMFNESTKYNGSASLYIDSDDDSKQFVVIDSAGMPAKDFTGDKIVSIFADMSGTRYRFVVSETTIEGTLEAIDEDSWQVDGKQYRLDKSAMPSADIGKNYKMLLNYLGEIVFVSEKSYDNYGFILELSDKGGFKKPQARILKAGAVDFGINVDADNVDAERKPFLIAGNKAVCTVSFADRISINQSSYKGDELWTALENIKLSDEAIKYNINADGEVYSISSLTPYGGSKTIDLMYNVYEMVFGGKDTIAGFAIDADTRVICRPTNASASDDDCMLALKIDDSNQNTGYIVTGYEKDEATKRAKLLLIRSAMDADDQRPVNIDSSRAAMVTKASTKLNSETGEAGFVVELFQDGEAKSFETLKPSGGALSSLTAGDVIIFIANQSGKMDNALVVCRSSKFASDFKEENNLESYEHAFGTVDSLITDEVDSPNKRMVSRLTLNIEGKGSYTYNIPQRNKPSIYIYNKNSDVVENGSISDIRPGADKVYALRKIGATTLKAVIIVR